MTSYVANTAPDGLPKILGFFSPRAKLFSQVTISYDTSIIEVIILLSYKHKQKQQYCVHCYDSSSSWKIHSFLLFMDYFPPTNIYVQQSKTVKQTVKSLNRSRKLSAPKL